MPRKKSKIKLLKEECEKLMNEVAELLWEKECSNSPFYSKTLGKTFNL